MPRGTVAVHKGWLTRRGGSHLRSQDLWPLAVCFGFNNENEFEAFMLEQQAKANARACGDLDDYESQQ